MNPVEEYIVQEWDNQSRISLDWKVDIRVDSLNVHSSKKYVKFHKKLNVRYEISSSGDLEAGNLFKLDSIHSIKFSKELYSIISEKILPFDLEYCVVFIDTPIQIHFQMTEGFIKFINKKYPKTVNKPIIIYNSLSLDDKIVLVRFVMSNAKFLNKKYEKLDNLVDPICQEFL